MHKSFFSYKLERRYHFKWFTWVIIIGGVALTAIFSTINVAVNGYETSIIYTTDLNSTTPKILVRQSLILLDKQDPTIPFSLTAVDKMPNSPLWWSWAMLLWYHIESLSTFNSMTDASDDDILKGFANLYQAFFVNSSEPDVKSEYFLLVHEGYFYLNDLSTRDNIVFDPDQSVPNWAQHPEKYGNISFAINNYVKSFYTLIMTDLGSSNPTLVSDTETLRSYTESFRHGPSYGMFRPLTTQSFVDSSRNGQPEDFMMKPATSYAQYTCQLPKLKSTGSLIAAVVLADLVFLSAAWNLLNWGASGWLRRGDRMAMFCEGCAQSRQTTAPCAGSDPEDGNTSVVDVEERSSQNPSRDGQFGESTYELLEREVQ
ncbi:hypothetical protein SCUP515_12103 [Seiridium cupressi]